MKKIITLLLLSLFSFHILGVYVSFHVREHYIKKDIKRRIKKGVPEEELAHIIYKPSIKNQFEWTRQAEFRYGGTMYDIVRTEYVNDSTQIFHCVNDTQETLLFADLERLLEEELAVNFPSKKGNKGSSSAKSLYKTLSKYVADTQIAILDIDWITIYSKTRLTFCHYFNHYYSLHLDIHSPPPKYVSFS